MTSRLPGEISSSRPLRCTSLHQSISAESPSTPSTSRLSQSVPSDNLLEPSATFSDESDSDKSNSNASVEQQDVACSVPKTAPESHRAQIRDGRPRRRMSSTSGGTLRSKRLSLAYTSPKTTAEAMSIFHLRKDADRIHGLNPERAEDRETFLAELPSAIAHVRNVNYRRGALLPRPKSFTRVQQTLSEEISPVESDAQKEAKLATILRGKEHALKAQDDIDAILDDLASKGPSRDSISPDSPPRQAISGKSGDDSHTSFDVLGTPIQEEDVFSFDDLSPGFVRPALYSPVLEARDKATRPPRKRRNSEDIRFEP